MLGYGSIHEMEETLGHAEWNRWIDFYRLYDLPDVYFLAAKFGAYMVGIEPSKVSPIYEPDQPLGSRGIPEFIAFASGYLKSSQSHVCRPAKMRHRHSAQDK